MKSLATLPTFIIIGTMKGGTSSLHRYLSAHPSIGMARVKETNFFRTPRDFERGAEWYASLFPNALHRGEASPGYSQAQAYPGVPARMHSVVPDARLVYLVRDPVERMISHWMHNRAAGRERRPIEHATSGSANHYVLTSRYYYQLEHYLEYYAPAQILVIASEDLRTRTEATVGAVLRFLGIQEPFTSPEFDRRYNRSEEKGLPRAIERWIPGHRLRAVAEKVLPASLTKRTPIERPVLDAAIRARFGSLFEEDVAKLRQLTGREFASWSL